MEYARLHNKSIEFRFRLHPRVFLTVGLEHFSLWAGNSPLFGDQPASYKDYIRMSVV